MLLKPFIICFRCRGNGSKSKIVSGMPSNKLPQSKEAKISQFADDTTSTLICSDINALKKA